MLLILAESEWFSNLVTLQDAAKYGNLWDKKRISKYVQIQLWDNNNYMVTKKDSKNKLVNKVKNILLVNLHGR